jgi:hypothetical protein
VKIKPSARRALKVCSALYLTDGFDGDSTTTPARERFALWVQNAAGTDLIKALPVYMREDLPQLITRIQAISPTLAA